MCLRAGFKNPAKLALRERIAELEAHERVGRVARNGPVIPVLNIGDHCEIRVADRLIQLEPLIVGDGRYEFADTLAAGLDLGSDLFDIIQRLKMQAFIVEEKNIA